MNASEIIKNIEAEQLKADAPEFRVGDTVKVYAKIKEGNRERIQVFEGVVLKKVDSLYIMGKKPMWQWMKLKQKDEADFFVTGYEDPKVEYTGKNITDWNYWKEVNGILMPVTKYYYMGWIGAIEFSAYVNGEVTKICTCSGISEELRAEISANPAKYINRVAKVTFMEKTEAGYPRHPRFEQFHESKTARECTWELAEV